MPFSSNKVAAAARQMKSSKVLSHDHGRLELVLSLPGLALSHSFKDALRHVPAPPPLRGGGPPAPDLLVEVGPLPPDVAEPGHEAVHRVADLNFREGRGMKAFFCHFNMRRIDYARKMGSRSQMIFSHQYGWVYGISKYRLPYSIRHFLPG